MTKSELRHARREAKSKGLPLTGTLAISQNPKASNRTLRRKASRIRAKKRKESTN